MLEVWPAQQNSVLSLELGDVPGDDSGGSSDAGAAELISVFFHGGLQ